MANSYYGPGMALSALSQAASSLLGGIASGEEQAAKRERQEAEMTLVEPRRKFLEAQTTQMSRPRALSAGRHIVQETPEGAWRSVFEAPEPAQSVAQAEHFRAMTQKLIEDTQLGRDFRAGLPALYDAATKSGVPPLVARTILHVQTPQQLTDLVERLITTTMKAPTEPKGLLDMMRAAEDPTLPPETRERYKRVIEMYNKQRLNESLQRAQGQYGLNEALATQKRLSDAGEGITMVRGIIEAIEDASSRVNTFAAEQRITDLPKRLIAELAQSPGLGESIVALRALEARLSQLRGPLGQVGVLSDRDMALLSQMIPGPHDTFGAAQARIRQIKKIYADAIRDYNTRAREQYARLKEIYKNLGVRLAIPASPAILEEFAEPDAPAFPPGGRPR